VPGSIIEQEIMQGEVPLCKSCSDPSKSLKKATNNAQKRNRKSDSDDEEDEPLFPPWIMKVIALAISDSSF
jgi:NAD-dependent histone deacetylase SIR2